MQKLKSYWYIDGFSETYPSLAHAKSAVFDYFKPHERYKLLMNGQIFHDVNGLTVSVVSIRIDKDCHPSFSRPRKL